MAEGHDWRSGMLSKQVGVIKIKGYSDTARNQLTVMRLISVPHSIRRHIENSGLVDAYHQAYSMLNNIHLLLQKNKSF